jgi:hypothetical protein
VLRRDDISKNKKIQVGQGLAANLESLLEVVSCPDLSEKC